MERPPRALESHSPAAPEAKPKSWPAPSAPETIELARGSLRGSVMSATRTRTRASAALKDTSITQNPRKTRGMLRFFSPSGRTRKPHAHSDVQASTIIGLHLNPV